MGSRYLSRTVAAAVGIVLIAAMSACGANGGVADKTGGHTVVLTFATIDDINANGQEPAPQLFVNEIESLSHGQIKVNLKEPFELGRPSAESDLVSAISRGQIDGGWPSTRAFQSAGIPGPDALEAPFVVTNVNAEAAIINGPAGAAVLASLDKTGVLGLALTEGPLRRPWSEAGHPLTTLAAWHGVTFRDYNSPVQDQTIRALGGVPVAASFNFPDLVHEKKLDGVETDVAQYEHDGYGPLLPAAVRNAVLWPRMGVLALSRKTFDRLDQQQQGWVRQAALDAGRASVAYHYDEGHLATLLCGHGVHFYDASAAALAAMQAAVAPVISTLLADPTAGPVLRLVQKAVAANPGVDTPAVPASCLTSKG